MAEEWITLVSLGHSGGAVPGFHRSSLFVGHFQRKQPTTNARSAGHDTRSGNVCKRPDKK
jgi:hypothetical protein